MIRVRIMPAKRESVIYFLIECQSAMDSRAEGLTLEALRLMDSAVTQQTSRVARQPIEGASISDPTHSLVRLCTAPLGTFFKSSNLMLIVLLSQTRTSFVSIQS